jgi:microcystin-dependent protein
LFGVVGTTYGVGNGSTTFNVPDLRGRVAVGLDNMGGTDATRLDLANTLGTSAGAQYHTLTTAQLASHTHTGPSHTHTFTTSDVSANHSHNYYDSFYAEGDQANYGFGGSPVGSDYDNSPIGYQWYRATEGHSTGHTHSGTTAGSGTGATGSAGGDTAHNNMQPSLLLNYIIKT